MTSEAVPADCREILERCQRRFPTIDLPADGFFARAERSGVPLDQLHTEDLYLASACAHGDRLAWEYFADEYLPLVRKLAAQACRQFQESEDLAQEIVAQLIGDRGKLGGYDGRGSLAGWLRVTIARAAIDRFRRVRREVSWEETSERGGEPSATVEDPQGASESLDARWGPVLARILAEQIGRLEARDRLLLSLYYMSEVPLKIIGRQFGVHEATVSRWLDRIRNTLRTGVEKELRRRHGLRPRETDTLWRWVAEEERFSLKEIL
jgi:RNA polymerase sigma-70 factor